MKSKLFLILLFWVSKTIFANISDSITVNEIIKLARKHYQEIEAVKIKSTKNCKGFNFFSFSETSEKDSIWKFKLSYNDDNALVKIEMKGDYYTYDFFISQTENFRFMFVTQIVNKGRVKTEIPCFFVKSGNFWYLLRSETNETFFKGNIYSLVSFYKMNHQNPLFYTEQLTFCKSRLVFGANWTYNETNVVKNTFGSCRSFELNESTTFLELRKLASNINAGLVISKSIIPAIGIEKKTLWQWDEQNFWEFVDY